jgi:L-fuconolactonase
MIDTHQHFWKFTPEEFDWLQGTFAGLRRDFLPEHLRATISKTDVTGFVSVQARRTLAETEWLLEMADQEKLILGVVGWIPLKEKSAGDILDRLRLRPAFKGVREVLQGAPDAEYLTDPDFNRGIRELTKRNIPYDLLVFHDQLPAVIRFVLGHPDQIFILDHLAKPEIREDFAVNWARDMRALASLENVYCKFSGVVTEVRESNWDLELLRPYFEVVWEAFGPKRLMFGSDWPVCLARIEYQQWIEIVEQLVASFSASERRQFFQETAQRAYRL